MIVVSVVANGNAPPSVFIIVGCGVLVYLAYGSYQIDKLAQRFHRKWNQNENNAALFAFLLGVSLIAFGVFRLVGS